MMTQPEYADTARDANEELREADIFERLKETFSVDFVTGLPCGELRSFIREAGESHDVQHVPVTNERESIGVATGAWLAGKTPALYMQNSGFFVASNDIASLMIPSGVDAVFVISWRGGIGETATQHMTTGNSTPFLLESFGIATTASPTLESIQDVKQRSAASHTPAAVLVKRERFNTQLEGYPIEPRRRLVTECYSEPIQEERLNRDDALDVIVAATDNQWPTISSTGLISRSMFERHDCENHFYNAGGFGLTSTIALGVALARPETTVMSVEGDGSVLTNLGTLNVIGEYAPHNLVHVVLDNQALVSCSHEPSIGNQQISQFAVAAGYAKVYDLWTEEGIVEALHTIKANPQHGPVMLHVHIRQDGPRDYKRPLGMLETAQRFRAFMDR